MTWLATNLVEIGSRVRQASGNLDGLVLAVTFNALFLLAFHTVIVALLGSMLLAVVVPAGLLAAALYGNLVKRRTLGLPIVASDLALALDVFRHPRFYFTFVDWRVLLGAAVALPVVIALAWVLGRSPLFDLTYLLSCLALMTAAGLVAWPLAVAIARREPVDRWPDRHYTDQLFLRVGLLGSLAIQLLHARRRPPAALLDRASAAAKLPAIPPGLPGAAPLIVAVQAESFIDPRLIQGEGALDIRLPSFDRAVASAARHGTISVPCWGGETIRSEFSFLTGIENRTLGLAGFNPYLAIGEPGPPSLPKRLRAAGYRCEVFHPYDGHYFQRHRVMPLLGFDRFHDLAAFVPPKDGSFLPDRILAEAMLARARQTEEPLFLFGITIENHGPWIAPRGARPAPTGDAALDAARAQLAAYAERAAGADALLGTLLQGARTLGRRIVLLFFGDHPPALLQFYRQFDIRPERAPYLIWDSAATGRGEARDCDVSDLATQLVEIAAGARDRLRDMREAGA